MKTQKCTKCGIEKPLTAEYYNRNKSTRSGFSNQCKNCRAEYRKDNKGNISEYYAKYRKKNKAKLDERSAKWRENNKKYLDKYYQKNRDTILARTAEWNEKRNDKQVACVYQILNNINGKIYIGETLRGELRWKRHLHDLKGKRHPNPKLQADFNKFGEEAFEWSIIKEMDKDKETLVLEEAKTIDSFLKEGKELYNKQLKLLQEEK